MPPSFWVTGRRWNAGWAWGALTLGAIPGIWRPTRIQSKEPLCCRARTSPLWALLLLPWRWALKTLTSSRGPRVAPIPAKPVNSRASRSRSAIGLASPQRNWTSWREASPKLTTLTSSCVRSWRCVLGWPSREYRYTRLGLGAGAQGGTGGPGHRGARYSALLRSRHLLNRKSSFSVLALARKIDRPQWTTSIVATSPRWNPSKNKTKTIKQAQLYWDVGSNSRLPRREPSCLPNS